MTRVLFAAAVLAVTSLFVADTTAQTVPRGNQGSGVDPALTAPAQCGACFAIVRSTGALAPSKGVLRAARLGVGTYEVIFRHPISACAWSATIGLDTFSGTVPSRTITTAGRAGTTNGVWINTFVPSSGALVDAPFHLVIHC